VHVSVLSSSAYLHSIRITGHPVAVKEQPTGGPNLGSPLLLDLRSAQVAEKSKFRMRLQKDIGHGRIPFAAKFSLFSPQAMFIGRG
jgi:hypothetical protein